jgi:hypothetical protein
MKVINEPSNKNINETLEDSDISMKSEMKTNEGDKIFSLKCNEPIEQDEEASFGFVLGYN